MLCGQMNPVLSLYTNRESTAWKAGYAREVIVKGKMVIFETENWKQHGDLLAVDWIKTKLQLSQAGDDFSM